MLAPGRNTPQGSRVVSTLDTLQSSIRQPLPSASFVAPKPSKYHAIRTEYAGRTYDSKREAEQAQALDVALATRQITVVDAPTVRAPGPSPRAVCARFPRDRSGRLLVLRWDGKGVETERFQVIRQLAGLH